MAFQDLVKRLCPADRFGVRDASAALVDLFRLCVPNAREIFKDAFSVPRLFHINGYVMEKAFVYGIICLSKWLGPGDYPCGVFGHWPPELPDDHQPRLPAPPAPIDVG